MLSTIMIVAACASCIAAVPVTKSTDGFSIPIVHTPLEIRDPLAAMFKIYQRYGEGLELPEELLPYAEQQNQKRDVSTVVAKPTARDVEYWCPVLIGDDTLQLNFDTGSSTLWTFSSDTPPSQRGSHRLYTPGKTSVEQTGQTWSVSYADGSKASGKVYYDSVKVGSISVPYQAVQAATSVSGGFISNAPIDGLFGLGFAKLNNIKPTRSPTWFANAMDKLTLGVFTADLRPGTAGAYTFGFINSSRHTGSITYQPLHSTAASRGWWLVDATKGYKICDQAFQDSTGGAAGAVFDTGSTLLMMSDEIVKNYYKKVTASQFAANRGGWIYPCAAKLPDFYVPVGSTYAKIEGKHMTYTKLDTQGRTCFGSLQTLGEKNKNLPYIYGDILFKANYVVFDMKNERIGFAPKRS